MTQIFISYRRDDSKWPASRLHDHLSSRFGEDNVFFDVATISPGEDFVRAIDKAVSQCDAMIVVMGKSWLSMKGDDGIRRLDDPRDFVRIEVSIALSKNKYVIPLLVDDAHMPDADEMPPELVALSRRNALTVRNESFRQDVSLLIRSLEKITNTKSLSLIVGQWHDHITGSATYFKQNEDKVVGFYDLGAKQKLGLYLGTVNGNNGDLSFEVLQDNLKGFVRVSLVRGNTRLIVLREMAKRILRLTPRSVNQLKPARDDLNEVLTVANTISGYWWLTSEPNRLVPIVLSYVSDQMPNWLTDADFEKYSSFLTSTAL